ncbi:MAG: hypothetical protein SFU25_06825 [Candidatus Caenarcaniphilales bacterium]|nr:hypothetical protein [Candidatus Caenarcaniphilales bacterium]
MPYFTKIAEYAEKNKLALDLVVVGLPGQDLSNIKGMVVENGKLVGLSPSIYSIQNPGKTYRDSLKNSLETLTQLYDPQTNFTIIPLSASCLGALEGSASIASQNLERSTNPGSVRVFLLSCYGGLTSFFSNNPLRSGTFQNVGRTFISPFINLGGIGELKPTGFASPIEVSTQNPPRQSILEKLGSKPSQAEALSNLKNSILSQTALGGNVNVAAVQVDWTSTLGEERRRFITLIGPQIAQSNLPNFSAQFIGSTGDKTANWGIQQQISSSLGNFALPPIGLAGDTHNLGRSSNQTLEKVMQPILESLIDQQGKPTKSEG